jgi:hypothetical protein
VLGAAVTVVALSAFPVAALADSRPLSYRGFTVDLSAVQGAPNFDAVEASVKHQLDIVADCGASPAVLAFFRSQLITLKIGQTDGGGHFSAGQKGVSLDAAVQAPQKPVILHELLHAYHARVLPEASQNPDIIRFYNIARQNQLYPAGEYLLKNPFEFFAVTGSLYLWGNVDRAPHNRATLHSKQPFYYKWLAQLFGVEKDADEAKPS